MPDKERALAMKKIDDKHMEIFSKKVFDALNSVEAKNNMERFSKIKWVSAAGWKNTPLKEVQEQEVILECKCCGEKTIKAILPGCPPEFCDVCEKAYAEYKTKGICHK